MYCLPHSFYAYAQGFQRHAEKLHTKQKKAISLTDCVLNKTCSQAWCQYGANLDQRAADIYIERLFTAMAVSIVVAAATESVGTKHHYPCGGV